MENISREPIRMWSTERGWRLTDPTTRGPYTGRDNAYYVVRGEYVDKEEYEKYLDLIKDVDITLEF